MLLTSISSAPAGIGKERASPTAVKSMASLLKTAAWNHGGAGGCGLLHNDPLARESPGWKVCSLVANKLPQVLRIHTIPDHWKLNGCKKRNMDSRHVLEDLEVMDAMEDWRAGSAGTVLEAWRLAGCLDL
nr:hypothetical protein Iba_chr12cCG11130 [Ipomoea batatas]